MLGALIRASGQLFAPALRRVVGLSLAIAVGSFAVLWLGVGLTLRHLPTIGWQLLDWLIDLLGVVGVALLSWLLFPAVVTMIMGLFVERVAAGVEAVDYPGRGAPRRQSIREALMMSLRLTLLTIVLNLAMLPIYVLLPGVNVFAFLGLNGYLLGREYFEMVASRRLDIVAVTTMRRRFGGRIFCAGAMIAGLFALPFVNLVAPVVATAFMVHVFEGLPARAAAARSS
jgi:CysZ protein